METVHFFPPEPGASMTYIASIDHNGHPLEITLPYSTDDDRIIRALRREFDIRENKIERHRNLIKNPSIEITEVGWEVVQGGAGVLAWDVLRTTAHKHGGVASVKVWEGEGTGVGYVGAGTASDYWLNVKADTPITAAAWARQDSIDGGTRPLYTAMRWYTYEGIFIREDVSESVDIAPGVWSRSPAFLAFAPTNAVSGEFICRMGNPKEGDVFYVDDAVATKTLGGLPDYFDGDDPSPYIEWAGAPHDSESIWWW